MITKTALGMASVGRLLTAPLWLTGKAFRGVTRGVTNLGWNYGVKPIGRLGAHVGLGAVNAGIHGVSTLTQQAVKHPKLTFNTLGIGAVAGTEYIPKYTQHVNTFAPQSTYMNYGRIQSVQ